MDERPPEALMELVRILREQLARKEDRIQMLEDLLRDATERAGAQQRLLVSYLHRTSGSFPNGISPSPYEVATGNIAAVDGSIVLRTRVAGPSMQEQPPSDSEPPDPDQREPALRLPGRLLSIGSGAVSAEADATSAAIRAPANDGPVEITARLDGSELRRGHRAQGSKQRGAWPWRAGKRS